MLQLVIGSKQQVKPSRPSGWFGFLKLKSI